MARSEIMEAEAVDFSGASCAFGVFDGVHEGHRFIIERAVADGRERGAPSIIITFDRDPEELFRPEVCDKLMGNEERLRMLAALGADAVAVIPFDEAVASLEPGPFLVRLFAKGAPRRISVGEDFRFGAKAAGTVDALRTWGAAHGMEVEAAPLLQMDGAPVTSTRIRAFLSEGNVQEAARLLGRPYGLSGLVEPGRQAGREMGICTANLRPAPDRAVPADGVYAAYATVGGERLKSAVSIGVPITFDGVTTSTIEAHILDFDRDIYGEEMALEFMAHLRPMERFASTEDLVSAIQGDISFVRENL